MAVLKYEDLLAEVNREREENGLHFTCKDGRTVTLSPVTILGDEELKVVEELLSVVSDDDAENHVRLEAMDSMLLAAAGNSAAFKESLFDIPPQYRTKIFEAWMAATEPGEASA